MLYMSLQGSVCVKFAYLEGFAEGIFLLLLVFSASTIIYEP